MTRTSGTCLSSQLRCSWHQEGRPPPGVATNFAGDAAYAVVQSVQVKSGVLWIYTSTPPGDTRSATAVCGLGSAWVYSDPDALDAQLWGVSVRASGGQRLVQREGFDDDCS